MEPASRIEAAKRRLRTTRISVAILSAAGFAVFAFAARASHPGTSAASTSNATSSSAATATDDDQSGSFGFGQASIGPSSGDVPSARSGGS
jgi:hypothetical protein